MPICPKVPKSWKKECENFVSLPPSPTHSTHRKLFSGGEGTGNKGKPEVICDIFRIPESCSSMRTAYVICGVQWQMKTQGPLLTNYQEFQDGDSSALSQTQGPLRMGTGGSSMQPARAPCEVHCYDSWILHTGAGICWGRALAVGKRDGAVSIMRALAGDPEAS